MPSSADNRWAALEAAAHNAARLPAAEVPLDLSSDAVAGLRGATWAGLGAGDATELAGQHLGAALADVLGVRHWLPAHLGRGAESVLATLVRPGQWVVGNEVYTTARWSIERRGGSVLETGLTEIGAVLDRLPVAFVLVTAPRVGLSSAGGQVVSLAELAHLRRLLDLRAPDVPLVFDGSRLFQHAAWLVHHEPGQQGRPVVDVVRALVRRADLVVLSARKDIGAAAGGLLLAHDERWLGRLAEATRLLEGGLSTGGLSPDDLVAVAHGLRRAAEARPGAWRVAAVERLARRLLRRNVPVVAWGAGAIWLDACRALPRLAADRLPAQSLVNVLYLQAGVRAIGTPAEVSPASAQLVRVAVRPGSARFLTDALPALLAGDHPLAGGLRRGRGPVPGPFQAPHEPVEPQEWAALRPVGEPPRRRCPPEHWGRLEEAVRARLHLGPEWGLVPAPRERGPQRLLVEAWARLTPGGGVRSDDPQLAALGDHWWAASANLGDAGRRAWLWAGELADLGPMLAARRPGDAVAVNLGPLDRWPAGVPPGPDALWACDPGGPAAGGGLLGLLAGSALDRAVRTSMLFAVGSPSDGGLPPPALAALTQAVRRARLANPRAGDATMA